MFCHLFCLQLTVVFHDWHNHNHIQYHRILQCGIFYFRHIILSLTFYFLSVCILWTIGKCYERFFEKCFKIPSKYTFPIELDTSLRFSCSWNMEMNLLECKMNLKTVILMFFYQKCNVISYKFPVIATKHVMVSSVVFITTFYK